MYQSVLHLDHIALESLAKNRQLPFDLSHVLQAHSLATQGCCSGRFLTRRISSGCMIKSWLKDGRARLKC